jgi:biopolymer transport protein ExbD
MGMSASSAGTTTVKASPNVIPMIDIMLVLLIIFMIVTPLISAGFKATMPKDYLDAPRRRRRASSSAST